MKTSVFPFEPDANLIADVGCLLQFIKQPLPLDKFFKKFPNQFLNAKLEQLEFDNQDLEKNFFNIGLKTRWRNKQINLTSELVRPLGITITDKNQLIEKLKLDKFLTPELTLKESLKQIIDSHTKNSINLNIDDVINLIQEKNSLQLHKNKEESEEQVKIRLFFIFLKIFVQKYTLSKNSHFSPEFLINSTACLTTLFASGINDFIVCLKDNLTFAEEPTEKSEKEQQETNISKIVFSYDQLLTKLAVLAPKSDKKNIKQLLDSIIETSIDNKLISKYNFFKQAYFTEKGFLSVFGGYSGYDSIQICRKKLDVIRPISQNFLQLIDELTTHINKVPEIIDLSVILKERADIYFQSLLYSSAFKKENEESLDRSAFEDFTSNIQTEISNFQKKYLPTIEIEGALNKILNALFKCVPKFLISREQRISFFQEKMPEIKLLDKIGNTVPLMKI